MLKSIAIFLAALVGLEHFAFMVLEMFFFESTIGPALLGPITFDQTMIDMAANQGLYNGFLAAGIFWGLMTGRRAVVSFFLICVIIAGLFGAATIKSSIAITQALPAALALIAWTLARRQQAN